MNKKILDVSNNKQFLSEFTQHFFQELNQLYRPCGDNICKQDFYDIVYSGDSNINETKFYPILLKERFYLVSKNGFLVIKYYPNKILDSLKLEDELWKQWKGKYDIIEHKINETNFVDYNHIINYINVSDNNYLSDIDEGFDDFKINYFEKKEWILILKKKESTILIGDDINRWTFGIITNGTRNDWINQLLDSIRKQKILEYEIIICGKYDNNVNASDIKYIPFNKRTGLGWITKKKNLIIENSNYQNICILHDRYYLDKNWFLGIKKWGNNFEHITVRQFHENNMKKSVEIMDVMNPKIIETNFLRQRKLFFYSKFDDKDFSTNHYIGGGIHIGKKEIFSKVWFNNVLFWQDGEDVDISCNLNTLGYYARLNPYSLAITKRPHIEFGNKTLNIPTDFKKNYNPKKDIYHIHSYYMYIIVYLSEKSYTNIYLKKIYNFLKYIHKNLKIDKFI